MNFVRDFSEEKISFDAGGEVWDVNLGDITVGLSELTVCPLSKEGVRLGLQTNKMDFMFF